MSTVDAERAARTQERLLGGPLVLTARQMAAGAGVELEAFNEYWLAMGFPTPDPDAVLFAEDDLASFIKWNEMLQQGQLGAGTGLSLTRAQSHLADRLALWQTEALVEEYVRTLQLDDTSARALMVNRLNDLIPAFEAQLLSAWRRQMEALLDRAVVELENRPADHSRRRFPLTRALGFVDMVSYTARSNIMGERLVGLIEHFEYLCRSAVTAAGGRVVKMIGDAVFFIADDLPTGLAVVDHLLRTLEDTDGILPVRASLVLGDVFSRSGDVFGPPVNLAARLVDIAPEGHILTDASTATAIAAGRGGPGYDVSTFPSTKLRGLGKVNPYLVVPTQTPLDLSASPDLS